MDTIKINSKKTLMVAHRGVSGIECENTAAAFVAAGNRSYFGIETDVHKTADGKFVVFHDDDTTRMCEEDLIIENSNYDVLRKLRLKARDGKVREDLCVPSLEEYLRICKTYDKVGVLELKNHFEKSDVEKLLNIVREEYAIDKLIFISFDYDNLVYAKELDKTATVQYLCHCPVDDALIEKLLEHDMDIDIHFSFLDEDAIKRLHDNGIRINCWTVDEKCDAERLAEWGIDYITSNILEQYRNYNTFFCQADNDITAKDSTIYILKRCPKGEKYAVEECIHPTRTVTSIVRVENRKNTMVSVKTASPVPKENIFDVMELIKKTSVKAHVKIGDIVLTNIFGTDIITTKDIV